MSRIGIIAKFCGILTGFPKQVAVVTLAIALILAHHPHCHCHCPLCCCHGCLPTTHVTIAIALPPSPSLLPATLITAATPLIITHHSHCHRHCHQCCCLPTAFIGIAITLATVSIAITITCHPWNGARKCGSKRYLYKFYSKSNCIP